MSNTNTPTPTSSILVTIRKMLGPSEDYSAFDPDLIVFINSFLSELNQLGIGPEDGVLVTDESTTWSELTNDDKTLGLVHSFIYYKTKLSFDPPPSSFAVTAMEKLADRAEWRLKIKADELHRRHIAD